MILRLEILVSRRLYLMYIIFCVYFEHKNEQLLYVESLFIQEKPKFPAQCGRVCLQSQQQGDWDKGPASWRQIYGKNTSWTPSNGLGLPHALWRVVIPSHRNESTSIKKFMIETTMILFSLVWLSYPSCENITQVKIQVYHMCKKMKLSLHRTLSVIQCAEK